MSDPDELLDAFDDSLRRGVPTPRQVVHRDGLWHQVFHCLVVRRAPPPTVLLQRRPQTARAFAGLLDISATGHLRAGEQPTDGVRELAEELGIIAAPSDLVPLGRRLMIDDDGPDDPRANDQRANSSSANNMRANSSREGRNREIVHAFLLPWDVPLEAIDLTGCDVDGVVEIEVAALASLLSDATATVPCRELGVDGTVRAGTCTAADLVPATDGSWIVLAIMAERFVEGRAPLAI